jgi:glucose-6-phosphate isomerase
MKDTPAWRAIAAHRDVLAKQRIEDLWRDDPRRGADFTFHCGGIALDFSKQKVTRETLKLLVELAKASGVPHAIERLFAADRVNATEKRPALHMALRGDEHVQVDGTDVLPEIERNRDRIRVFANAVRGGQWKGATGLKITHVVAIGIGGSALGPQLAIEALRDRANGPEVRFIANIDPADFDDAVAGLKPASTLIVVASKTFTTQETMVNAAAARNWIAAALGADAVSKHIIGATANAGEAVKWGLPDCNVFPFHDWVGGRYSLWSSVGIPIALAIGMQGFDELLAGAHAVDLEFRSCPLERNVPALLGLIDTWNRNALGVPSHAVLPYASRLASLPAYLQQLEMESNGKRVDAAGKPVGVETCPVIWGGTETPGQHAFHQWLHQGTDIASCDFIVSASPMGNELEHHRILLANACAQSEALMAGVQAKEPWRTCPGDRMSTTFVLPQLDPRHLGALLAIYEHKVFVQATVWGINPFDQYGVELGKTIAGRILPALRGAQADLHPATRHLLGVIQKLGGPH